MRRAEGRIIRDKLLGDGIPMYPFTVYHVTEPLDRRYTFYAESEGLRSKWLAAFQEAKTIRDTYQNENKACIQRCFPRLLTSTLDLVFCHQLVEREKV